VKTRPKTECGCGTAPNVMVYCSGISDTAEIGGRASRLLHRAGAVKMSCLAGIGGRVDKIVDN
jgi:uncharacterized metal-binding protein